MPDIDFIYFDLGKVILNFDHEIAYRNVAVVANVDEAIVRQAIADSDLQTRYETGQIDDQEFHREFCELTNSCPSQDDLLVAISDMFSVNQPIIPLLAQLNARGFPMGILSNTCAAHWSFVRSRHRVLREFFSPLVLSFEEKSMKPDAGIYQAAISQCGANPDRIFFIDDREENVAGAIAAGIDAVLFTGFPDLVRDLQRRGIVINL